MYTVTKRIEISAAHSLNLPYKSKCKNIHGHNWIIEVEVSSEYLNHNGMVIDFTLIKKIVHKMDHTNLNDLLGTEYNCTAENIAAWIARDINKELENTFKKNFDFLENPVHVSKVTVQESEGNIACYIP